VPRLGRIVWLHPSPSKGQPTCRRVNDIAITAFRFGGSSERTADTEALAAASGRVSPEAIVRMVSCVPRDRHLEAINRHREPGSDCLILARIGPDTGTRAARSS
jgi:hypothetical protein